MSELHKEIKKMIIECLDLEDIDAEDITDDAPLFVEGLGLDSIDALEIGLMLQKKYGIKLESDSEATRQHFASVNSLVALVSSNRVN